MQRLGPWGPRVAVAVSGGADSLCLAWLTRNWGTALGLIVDHGLRPGSAIEADRTAARLAGFGMPSHTLRLAGLATGPGLAARARQARYAALTGACRAAGLVDLLLGHHAGDQAETVLMRAEAGSGPDGLAGMAAIVEQPDLRLLRPLLAMPPARLRATLLKAGLSWEEDPSNAAQAALRTGLRQRLAADPPLARQLLARAAAAAAARTAQAGPLAAILAQRASLYPEGYALLTPGALPPECLAALLRALGGRAYPAAAASLARLAAAPAPATLGGIRLLPAGRLGPGLLLVREPAAIGPAIPATDGALWDGRFRLHAPAPLPPGLTIAALGARAAAWRAASGLPEVVLRCLPALWQGSALWAVPALAHLAPHAEFTGWTNAGPRLTLCPPQAVAGAAWVGDAQLCGTHHVAG